MINKDHIQMTQSIDKLCYDVKKVAERVEKQDGKIDSLRSDMMLHFTNHLGEFKDLEKKVKKFGILMLAAVFFGVILNKIEIMIPFVIKVFTGGFF